MSKDLDRKEAGSPPSSARHSNGSIRYLSPVCLVASLAGLLFGFDTAVISGTVQRVQEQFALNELMQGWFTSSALVGCVLGAAIAGTLGDRFGRKPVLLASAVFFLASAIYSTVPQVFNVLVLARISCGIGIGMASVIAPMYISEFAPQAWRGRLVAFYQLSIVIGILTAYLSNWLVLRFAQTHPLAFAHWPSLHWILVAEYWRGMFGAEMLPAGLFLLLLFRVPETPRWLIQSGREAQGLVILKRIGGTEKANEQFTQIKNARETKQAAIGELFEPGLRRALLLGILLSVFGQLSGVNIVVYYGPKILAAAGFQNAGALLAQVGFGFINLVFTVLALLIIDRVGRRPLLISGMGIVTLALVAIGCVFLFAVRDESTVSQAMGLWVGGLICVYVAAIAFSICAVIWVLTPEIFPNRVRGRAMSLATFANWATNAFSAWVFPWYVAKFGMPVFFFTAAAICLVAVSYYWKCVPETRGRSLEEIENLWVEKRVSIKREPLPRSELA
ncbi:MAG TPA: sugar porter family MFS transporter [Verrucomicrobiae bacterium]|nr:sugar porter family MFS transporter [Verrucomicrobiae bacterium]